MYLAATSDQMVSPSEVVDAVWHEHLIFTKSYNAFCEVLGKKIEHVPSTHNKNEHDKFKAAKERTEKLYESSFGRQPEEFWKHKDIFDSLKLDKSRFKISTFILIGVFTVLVALFPAYYLLESVYLALDNPYFLATYIPLVVFALVLLEIYNKVRLNLLLSSWSRDSFVFDLSPMELVYAKTNDLAKIIHGCVNQAIEKKLIAISNYKLIAEKSSEYKNAREHTIIEEVKQHGEISYAALRKSLESKSVFANIYNSINAFNRYFSKSKFYLKLYSVNFVILSLLLIPAVIRLTTGLIYEKPITLISITVIVYLIIMVICLSRVRSLLMSIVIPQYYKKHLIPPVSEQENWEWHYFLMGSAVLTGTFLPLVNRSDRSFGSSDSSCGTSCGSSCSSCGGCGGD